MKLYVARHGQTQWNAENKICGRTDLPLTEEGLRQARALAEKVKDLGIDHIISSPMIRALDMAKIVSEKCGAPITLDDRLMEQNYGIYDGKDRKDPGFLANKRHFCVRYPGGESMMQMAARLYPLLDEIKRDYAGKTVLLTCHGAVCRVLRTYFVDMTNEEFFTYSPDNGELITYEL